MKNSCLQTYYQPSISYFIIIFARFVFHIDGFKEQHIKIVSFVYFRTLTYTTYDVTFESRNNTIATRTYGSTSYLFRFRISEILPLSAHKLITSYFAIKRKRTYNNAVSCFNTYISSKHITILYVCFSRTLFSTIPSHH